MRLNWNRYWMVLTMAIKIGTVSSLGDPTQFKRKFNDRQSLEEVIDGMHVHDEGYFDEGLIISATAEFTNEDWEVLKDYWVNRTKVQVFDHRGRQYLDRRLVVKEADDSPGLNNTIVTFELWAR